ncbi:MAG TPA: hypothetical protein VEY91_11990 [Candidatus Limnocylindria bacterium]|nr:hypothetical protein [Candidatus Limnocylindria bacterium]
MTARLPAAPRFSYAALLEVTPEGFVRSYPGLWEMDPERDAEIRGNPFLQFEAGKS